MKSTCILVGNGPSVLDSARGIEIDSHEQVVRFNRFTLGDFARHTGSRCDVWFTVRPVCLSAVQSRHPWKKVWCHSWEPKAEKCEVFQSHRTSEAGYAVEKIDHKILTEISDYFEAGFTYWSTGLLAIWMMLQEHADVTITGFDWWERTQHHYNDQEIRGTLHRPELERDCIKRLTAEGRLHFL